MKFFTVFSVLASAALADVNRDAVINDYQTPMNNADETQNYLNRQLMDKNSTVTSNNGILTFFRSVDGQIDNVISLVSDALAPLTGNVSKDVGNVLLSPFVQSVTDGAETLVAQLMNGGLQLVDSTVLNGFGSSFTKLANFAGDSNVDTSRLREIADQIQTSTQQLKKRDADDDYNYYGYQSSVDSAQQVQDSLNRQFKSSNSKSKSGTGITAFISGIDAQVGNVISLVSDALSPLTGGISKQIGNILLGPFVQTVTHGAEQLVGSLADGAISLVDPNALSSLVGGFSKLITMGNNNNVDVSRLSDLNRQIMNSVPDYNSDDSSQYY